MARLLGVQLPDQKRIDYALTLIYGLGWPSSRKILEQTGLDASTKVAAVSEEDLKKIQNVIEKGFATEGDLREDISENVKRLKEIGSYRGTRHVRGLPSRGQRTRSNGRTKKGKRKTVGALKKEVWAKLEQNKSSAPAPAAKK